MEAPVPVPDQEARIRFPDLGRRRAVIYPCAFVAAAALSAAALPATTNAMVVDIHSTRSTPTSSRTALVTYATRFVGTPYRWGGASPGGFDCSGLTSYVYGKFGVRMAHYTGAQYAAYRKVARNRLQPGDLVFFNGLGHTGMYIGRGRFIHATHSGDYVRISKLSEGYYARGYVGAVRPPLRSSALSATGPSIRKSAGTRWESSSASSA